MDSDGWVPIGEVSFDSLQFGLVSSYQHKVEAQLSEPEGVCQTDAGRSAGHHDPVARVI